MEFLNLIFKIRNIIFCVHDKFSKKYSEYIEFFLYKLEFCLLNKYKYIEIELNSNSLMLINDYYPYLEKLFLKVLDQKIFS